MTAYRYVRDGVHDAGVLHTYNGEPVDQVSIVGKGGDEIGGDAHDDEGGDPMEDVVGKNGRTMHLVRRAGGGTIVASVVRGHCGLWWD
jgi:hypothetical protein